MERIVVGIDGSPGARAALRWAVVEARAHGARLTAVHAWSVPAGPIGLDGNALITYQAYEEAARAVLDDVVGSTYVRGLVAPIEPVLREGGAAHVLVEAAKDADLLVVGSRGHGGFGALMLGSVGNQCTHHAPCPVVVVRGHVPASA
jgi:nucleotide-binding universal stress UspA family protein